MKHYAIQQTGRTPAMYFHTRGHRGDHVTELVTQTAADGTEVKVPVVKYVPNGLIGEWTDKPNEADIWDRDDIAEAFRAANVAPTFGACTIEDITALRGKKHRLEKRTGFVATVAGAIKRGVQKLLGK